MKIKISRLAQSNKNTKIHYFWSIDSTNEQAKRLVRRSDTFPALIIAKKQTSGRGRMGRSFFSKGGGIYMSYVYRAESSLCQAISVTTAAAVAVATALEGACDGEFGIKWVNDIICDGKKVCGILTESLIGVDGSTYVIVGIGINVGECRFPKEIENIAGSVDIKTSPEELISEIIQRLRHYVDSGFEAYMQGYRDRFILSGKHVTAIMDGECICGTVVGVDDDGALLLVPNGAISAVRIFSGEVSVRF